jgi:hypothetical protein
MLVSQCISAAALGMRSPAAYVPLKVAQQAWAWMQSLLWPHAVTFYMGQADQGDEYASVKAFADFCLARDVEAVQPYEMTQRWSHYRRFKTIQQRREFWARVEQVGWVRPLGAFDRNNAIARAYEINPRVYDGRFRAQAFTAKSAAVRYRDAMHPAMVRAQGREPGED